MEKTDDEVTGLSAPSVGACFAALANTCERSFFQLPGFSYRLGRLGLLGLGLLDLGLLDLGLGGVGGRHGESDLS